MFVLRTDVQLLQKYHSQWIKEYPNQWIKEKIGFFYTKNGEPDNIMTGVNNIMVYCPSILLNKFMEALRDAQHEHCTVNNLHWLSQHALISEHYQVVFDLHQSDSRMKVKQSDESRRKLANNGTVIGQQPGVARRTYV